MESVLSGSAACWGEGGGSTREGVTWQSQVTRRDTAFTFPLTAIFFMISGLKLKLGASH